MKDKENITVNIDTTSSTNKDKGATKKNIHFKVGKHKKLILSIAIIALVLVTSVVVYLFFNIKNSSKITEQQKPVATNESVYNKDVVDEAINKSTDNNYKQNIDQLLNDSKNISNEDTKVYYIQSAALIAGNNKNYEMCIKIANEADVINKDALNAVLVAQCAENKKDYKTAAEYYGIAAERSEKTTDVTLNTPYNDYKRKQQEMMQKL